MSTSKPYIENSFTNMLGHEIRVNDPVVVITMCTRSARIGIGRYLGYREYSNYYGSEKRLGVLVEVNANKRFFVHKETGEKFNWNTEYKAFPYPIHPHINNTTDRNKYNEEMNVYKLACEIRNGKINEVRKNYEWKDFPYKRCSTLILNKVYPVNVLLSSLATGKTL